MKNALFNLAYRIGDITGFFVNILVSFKEIGKIFKRLPYDFYSLGVGSLPIVLLTSTFTGMVSSVQIAYQIRDYAPLDLLGAGVAKMVMVELGPVLTALVVAGRIGAGIAAELGTMRVTEQIDALEFMAIDPIRFLVTPKIITGIVALPILTVFADFVAILGGAFVSKVVMQVSYSVFFQWIKTLFLPLDLFGGLLKSFVFGFIITFIGSYMGFSTMGGAVGVGKSTTKAVVYSSIFVLIADYFLGVWIFGK